MVSLGAKAARYLFYRLINPLKPSAGSADAGPPGDALVCRTYATALQSAHDRLFRCRRQVCLPKPSRACVFASLIIHVLARTGSAPSRSALPATQCSGHSLQCVSLWSNFCTTFSPTARRQTSEARFALVGATDVLSPTPTPTTPPTAPLRLSLPFFRCWTGFRWPCASCLWISLSSTRTITSITRSSTALSSVFWTADTTACWRFEEEGVGVVADRGPCVLRSTHHQPFSSSFAVSLCAVQAGLCTSGLLQQRHKHKSVRMGLGSIYRELCAENTSGGGFYIDGLQAPMALWCSSAMPSGSTPKPFRGRWQLACSAATTFGRVSSPSCGLSRAGTCLPPRAILSDLASF